MDINMETSNPNKKRLLSESVLSQVLIDPMQQYNYVIQCYNITENQVEGVKLKPVRESIFYSRCWGIFSKPVLLLLTVLLILVPVIGVLAYLLFVYFVVFYLVDLGIHRGNQAEVANIFKNMVYSPELCKITNSVNKFFEIKVQGTSFRIILY